MKKLLLSLTILANTAIAQRYDVGINGGINRIMSSDINKYTNFKQGSIWSIGGSIQPANFKFGALLELIQPGGNDIYEYGHPAFIPSVNAAYVIDFSKHIQGYIGLQYGRYYSSENVNPSSKLYSRINTDRGDVATALAGASVRICKGLFASIEFNYRKLFLKVNSDTKIPATTTSPSTVSTRIYPEQLEISTWAWGVHYQFGKQVKHVATRKAAADSHTIFIADELAKLKKLRDDGTLTEDEYQAQKKKLLDK